MKRKWKQIVIKNKRSDKKKIKIVKEKTKKVTKIKRNELYGNVND